MRSTTWTTGISIMILAMGLSAAAAQQFYVDSNGNMRRLPGHGWSTGPADPVPEAYIPARPVIRGSSDEVLRALVPSYDDPEWQAEGGRVLRYRGTIEDPYGGRSALPYDGNDPLYGPGDVSGTDDGLFGGSSAFASGDLSSGLARYSAAKRKALADVDPAARLAATRSANAYLVTLSSGDLTVAAIRAIDTLLGLKPVTKDSVQLPGAGTEVKAPGAKPTEADRAGAQRIIDYALLRNRGETSTDAVREVLGKEAELPEGSTIAGLDSFLGLDGGFAATFR